MGFTFRKLYPSLYIDCCAYFGSNIYIQVRGCPCPQIFCINPVQSSFVDCDCRISIPLNQQNQDGLGLRRSGCDGDLQLNDCGECWLIRCSASFPPGTVLCAPINNTETPCIGLRHYESCDLICAAPTQGGWQEKCCTRPGEQLLCSASPSVPRWNTAIHMFGLEECNKQGAYPYTYSIENATGITTGGFPCSVFQVDQNDDDVDIENYSTFVLSGYDSSFGSNTPIGVIGDTAFYSDKATFPYYGVTRGYKRLCLKQYTTPTQEDGIENRSMVISGKNVYRYAGHFADSRLGASDPFWDNPGGSGIKQLEQSLPISPTNPTTRSFPLLDLYSSLPLWGSRGQNNSGLEEDCRSPYFDCYTSTPGEDLEYRCFGCSCLRILPFDANTTNPDMVGIGHYLSNDAFGDGVGGTRGYTAGYFSFAGFNPHSYLDHIKLDNPLLSREESIVLAGAGNALGFGNFGPLAGALYPIRFNCDENGTNCIGCSGATSHGYRLGVPSCSVWSLIKGLYSRVFYAVKNNYEDPGSGGFGLYGCTESAFRQSFARFSSAIDTMLSVDPSGLTQGKTSNVSYHMAKVQEALYLDSADASRYGSDPQNPANDAFWFTFPNVFLWDRNAYTNASPTDRWKYLFIVGNANIMYDSRSIAIDKPFADFETNGYPYHQDIFDQDHISSVITLNSASHDNSKHAGARTEVESNAVGMARLILFPGSGGPKTGSAPDRYRRNASASLKLKYIPICTGVTASDGTESGIVRLSVCSVCNASETDTDPAGGAIPCVINQSKQDPLTDPGYNTKYGGDCSPVTEINAVSPSSFPTSIDLLYCTYGGGYLADFNSLTASFQIP